VPRLIALILLAASTLPACSDDHPDMDPYQSGWLGLYAIEAWSYNPTSCDAEGPSILGERTERGALVQACTIDSSTLNVRLCEDEMRCRQESCDGSLFSIDPPGWPFLRGDDVDGWAGASWRLPDEIDGHCEAVYREISAARDGDALVVRAKYWMTGDYGPPGSDGWCEIDDAARKAVSGAACMGYEVVRIRLRHPDCDPLAADACAEARLCQPYGNRFLCMPAEGPPAQVGEDCDARACAPGLICVDAGALPGCAAPGCCTELCDRAQGDYDGQCSQRDQGSLCAAYYDQGYEQPGREAIGVCYLVHRCDGYELPGEYVCDGTDDCDDGSDESQC
jgi:hypothetical protein